MRVPSTVTSPAKVALLPVTVKTSLPSEVIMIVSVDCFPVIPALEEPICQPFVFPVCSALAILLEPLTAPN